MVHLNPEPTTAAAPHEDVSSELDAILAVGHALNRLQDPHARARVLQWAIERFQVTATVLPALVSPMIETVDSMLAVDELIDLFGIAAPASPSAADEELSDLFDEKPSVSRRPLLELVVSAQPPVAEPPVEAPPLDSLVQDFVSDFRRIAMECQSAA
jgi:hypothetical protein